MPPKQNNWSAYNIFLGAELFFIVSFTTKQRSD